MYVHSCWERRANELRVLNGATECSGQLLHGTRLAGPGGAALLPALCFPSPSLVAAGVGCWLLCAVTDRCCCCCRTQ